MHKKLCNHFLNTVIGFLQCYNATNMLDLKGVIIFRYTNKPIFVISTQISTCVFTNVIKLVPVFCLHPVCYSYTMRRLIDALGVQCPYPGQRELIDPEVRDGLPGEPMEIDGEENPAAGQTRKTNSIYINMTFQSVS